MSRIICRLAAVLALLAATMVAQTNAGSWNPVTALTAGTDVRITAGSRTVRGRIDRVTDETIVVNSGKGQETFKRQEVMRVSLKRNGHRGRNVLIGLGIGAGVGIGAGAVDDANCRGFLCNDHLSTAVGGVLGAVVGTIVGALIPSGGWRAIYQK